MTEQLVVAPFVAAMLTALFSLASRNHTRLQGYVTGAGFLGYGIAAALLARQVYAGGGIAYQVGDWAAPFGITLVADPLSSFMVVLAGPVAISSLYHAARNEEYGRSYLPLLSFTLVGVTGAFLTGDIFNLFVWFEVTLMSSYVLVAYAGDRHATSTSLEYLAINLVGSSFMLVAIGGLYSTMGTLNMADLSRRLANPDVYSASPESALAFFGILFCVFGLKVGLAPFQMWVPDAYTAAPGSAASIMAGVSKKVGIYAILRIHIGLLSSSSFTYRILGAGFTATQLFGAAMMVMAAASILVGVSGALSRDSLGSMLAYSSISQVGFIFIPMGVAAYTGSTVAVAAALINVFHHALAKSMLFQITGVLKQCYGTDRFDRISGVATSSPVTAAAFFVGILSLIGVPPALGFLGKLYLFRAALAVPPLLAVAVAGGLFTLLYTTRAWNSVFWGEPEGTGSIEKGRVFAVAAVALLILTAGIEAQAVISAAEAASRVPFDQPGYRQLVLGGGQG